jgi:hypothetical protein
VSTQGETDVEGIVWVEVGEEVVDDPKRLETILFVGEKR